MNDQELLITLTEDIFKELDCSIYIEHQSKNDLIFTGYIGTTQDIILQPRFYNQFIVTLNIESKTIKLENTNPINIEDPELLNKLQLGIDSIRYN